MVKRFWWGAGVLLVAGAAVLLLPQTSEAQRRGFGGFGGLGNWGTGSSGFYGFGTGLGGFGAPSLGYGFPGSNYGYGWNNYGGYGLGNFGYGMGYGGYGNWNYAPGYTYTYPGYTYGNGMRLQSNQAFYPPQAASQSSPNEVHLMVVVPKSDAQIFIDGRQTQQRGFEREFVSEMKPGSSGTYHIKARWNQSGQTHEETRDVRVRPGQWQVVDFNQSLGTHNANPNDRTVTNPGQPNGKRTPPANNAENPENPRP